MPSPLFDDTLFIGLGINNPIFGRTNLAVTAPAPNGNNARARPSGENGRNNVHSGNNNNNGPNGKVLTGPPTVIGVSFSPFKYYIVPFLYDSV